MRQQLLQLSQAHLAAESQRLHAHLLARPEFQQAQHISIYLSMDECEPQTFALAEHALALGKAVYVPRCQKGTSVMDMVRVKELSGLARNKWGIAEPDSGEPAVDPRILDFVLVPGVAFDRFGGRCGHGKGYYDRYLARLSPNAFTCAICLSEQIIDLVPTTAQDAKPHLLLSPNGIEYP
ncbi:hypothetical protein IWW38_002078 [Coemansia aciculifera]|uniref:Uncharacterized protein n=1 Tax=Coemansia aciculifera TaxID=417176 RepID=A0ACC1M4K4_9FUNG|nr:hypothetical protein IWW38_002078 [Coemansia aciculifera]